MSYVSFDGHVLTDGYLVGNVQWQPSGQNVVTQEVPGRPGVVVEGSTATSAAVSMAIVAKAEDAETRREMVRQLRAWLASDGPRPLEFGRDGGLYCNAVMQEAAQVDYAGATELDVSFLIPDPYMYAVHSVKCTGDLFHVGGTATAMPVVTCRDAAPDASTGLWGVVLDNTTRMNIETSARSVAIDCATATATAGGAVAMITTDSDWWELEPGDHRAYVSSGTGNVTVEFVERWAI